MDTALDVVDPDDDVTSLREAIAAAPAGDRIEFSIAEPVIFLDHPDGELLVESSLSIHGPGADQLRLVPVGDDRRAFRLDDGDAVTVATIEISGLTLAGGDVVGAGGAIVNLEDLTLTDVVVTQNSAGGDGGGVWSPGPLSVVGGRIDANNAGGNGGGVWSASATRLSEAVAAGNSAAGDGGGVYSTADVTIADSTIGANTAADDGGGLWIAGELEVDRSTVSDNQAADNGGGIHADSNLRVTNSTVSGNRVVAGFGIGAGVFGRGPITLTSATVVGNQATGPDASAGGLWNDNDDVTIHNSVIALNTAPLFAPDLRTGAGSLTVTNSLIGNAEGSPLAGSATPNGDGALVGGADGVEPIDPGLGPLQDNGGPTLTHAPLADSPLLELGGDTAALSDQRGLPFVRRFDADGDGVARADAGAVERQQNTFVVDTLVDELDGDHSLGDLSLREAIQLANETIADFGDRIAFDPSLAGGTIRLDPNLGQLTVTDDLTISAAGLAERPIIDAGHGPDGVPRTGDGSRVLEAIDAELWLERIVITGGDLGGGRQHGGGVRSDSPMVIVDTILENNATNGDGGAVFAGAPLTLRDSIVRNNSGADGGGIAGGGGHHGIDDLDGIDLEEVLRTVPADEVVLIDSLVTGNRASRRGGGVAGLARITGSTITENEAGGVGGGVFLAPSSAAVSRDLVDTTIAGNVAGSDGGGVYASFGSLYTGGVTGTDVVITDNRAGRAGGGVAGPGGSFRFSSAEISGNISEEDGGGVYSPITGDGGGFVELADSTVTNNNSGPLGGGVMAGSVRAERSHFEGNTSTESGGALHTRDRLQMRQSLVRRNSSGVFAAVVDQDSEIIDSSITENSGTGIEGFALASGGRTLRLTNSTVADNGGPAVSWNSHTVEINGSTIVGDLSASVARLTAISSILAVGEFHGDPTTRVLDLSNTLLTNNAGAGLEEAPLGSPDEHGNLIGGPIFGVIDPLLGPLDDYGGPTPTLALLPGSPAIDSGAPPPSGVGEFDQRGEPFDRVVDGDSDGVARRDRGAFEFRPEGGAAVPGLLGDYNRDGLVSAADYPLWRDNLGRGVPFAYAGADGDGDGVITDGDRVVWNESFGLAATIPNTGFTPSVDGVVDAGWLGVAARPLHNNVFGVDPDANDAFATWRAVWNDTHLYVLVEVTDDAFVSDSAAPFEDDGVEIYVDPNFSRGSSYDRVDDTQYLVELDTVTPILSPSSPDGLAEGVTASSAVTDAGYRVEFAAPWSTLGVSPGDGLTLGLEVAVLDDDDGGAVDHKLQWHSDVNRAFQDPSRFGRVSLRDEREAITPRLTSSRPTSLVDDELLSAREQQTAFLSWSSTPNIEAGSSSGSTAAESRDESAAERARHTQLLLVVDEAHAESFGDTDFAATRPMAVDDEESELVISIEGELDAFGSLGL